MELLLLLCLVGDDEAVRVDGPPFIAFDEEADFEVVTDLEGASPVWRISDAPGGAVRAIETEPEFSSKDQTIRGAKKIKVKAVGKIEGDLRLTVTLEKGGRRVASVVHVARLGPVLRVPVQFRIVEHRKGGTADPDRLTKEFTDEVNRLWKACGIAFDFERGKPVRGKDSWFDADGRFHPVIRKDGKRERSATLSELLKCAEPSSIHVFVVRDCHWTEKARGLGDSTIEHSISGVGLEAEGAVFDDSADASTIAHELGHVLGLSDLAVECLKPWERPASERRRLMFSIRKYREAEGFTGEEMKTSRAVALHILKQTAARK